MNRGQLPTKYLSDSNWGAFDHASHAPQLQSDNYYMRSTAVSLPDKSVKAARIAYMHILVTFIKGALKWKSLRNRKVQAHARRVVYYRSVKSSRARGQLLYLPPLLMLTTTGL